VTRAFHWAAQNALAICFDAEEVILTVETGEEVEQTRDYRGVDLVEAVARAIAEEAGGHG
jgi:tartrate dehydratase alpha subunit/fumarate hydratase class I-like protein